MVSTKYIVINRTPHQIDLVIPAFHRKNSVSIMLASGRAINLAPFAGSVDECKRISQIHDLIVRGWIEVIEE